VERTIPGTERESIGEAERRACEGAAHAIDTGSRVLRIRPLAGGSSARVLAFECVTHAGAPRRYVLRRHGPRDLAANPNVARDEYRLMRALHGAGIAVPPPLYLDDGRTHLPTPFLVTDFVHGVMGLDADEPLGVARDMAVELARLHALDPAGLDVGFLPRHADRVAGFVADVAGRRDSAAWADRLRAAVAADELPPSREAVLHGDAWPGNVIWRDGRIAALLDWEDAGVGDPLADVGNARLELLWAFGAAAVEIFTATYRARAATTPWDHRLALWDLIAVARLVPRLDGFGLDDQALGARRDLAERFADRATAALA
jgi:aminoglycoside phosphotransferase (APT) family kinase protein